MKLVVVYTYGEPYEVGFHDAVTCVEYESAEQFYVDLCESFNDGTGEPQIVGCYTFYLDQDSFDSLKVYTLDEFWKEYRG